jgi:multiple sugar transport system substrate-binding protein
MHKLKAKNKSLFNVVFIFLSVLLMMGGLSGCGLKQGDVKAMRELNTPITLKYWRVFDGQDAFSEIINAYRQLHPNVNIEYRKLRYDEYEQALLEAWAEDKGPDIFAIHNTWIGKYVNKIEPMPESLKLPYALARDKKSGKVTKAGYRKVRTLTPEEIKDKFAEVVYKDVVRDGKIYGLPLSVDTLALFYNRTALDNAQITKVPSTWLEVKQAVKKLTLQNEKGEIVQAGIALGTANNINRAPDILSLLMMQNGTQMSSPQGQKATFNMTSSYAGSGSYRPGAEALRFYTDFASPAKEVYTWNEQMPEAAQAFIRGQVAMMLGYAYQIPLIKAQGGSKLDFGVAEVPHINQGGADAMGYKVDMASYWVETVAKKSQHSDYAWDFIRFATSAEQARHYLKQTKKPTALRALIKEQLNDYDLKPFANQVLTAKTWYRGKQPAVMEKIFRQMITAVASGKNTAAEAIDFAVAQVNRTY